jgi:hypothetical protein
MTKKRYIKGRFMLALRKAGMLCKRPTEAAKRIRISRTINPDGTVTHHHRLTEQPMNESNTFQTELHIWNEVHKDVKKNKKA